VRDNGSLTVLDSEVTSEANVLRIDSYDNSRMIFQNVYSRFFPNTEIELFNDSIASIGSSRLNGTVIRTYDDVTLEVENSTIYCGDFTGQSTVSFSNANTISLSFS
jgi:hypothetical protein